MNDSTRWASHDLYFAAYLITRGVPVLGTEGTKQTRWLFDATFPDFELIKTGWFDGTGVVPARAYSDQIRNLKSWVSERFQ